VGFQPHYLPPLVRKRKFFRVSSFFLCGQDSGNGSLFRLKLVPVWFWRRLFALLTSCFGGCFSFTGRLVCWICSLLVLVLAWLLC
jgi:hypothetical protein